MNMKNDMLEQKLEHSQYRTDYSMYMTDIEKMIETML